MSFHGLMLKRKAGDRKCWSAPQERDQCEGWERSGKDLSLEHLLATPGVGLWI